MTWEEYKEKHKDQLNERLGMGDKEQANYRRMLDEERNKKVNSEYLLIWSIVNVWSAAHGLK